MWYYFEVPQQNCNNDLICHGNLSVTSLFFSSLGNSVAKCLGALLLSKKKKRKKKKPPPPNFPFTLMYFITFSSCFKIITYFSTGNSEFDPTSCAVTEGNENGRPYCDNAHSVKLERGDRI